MYRVDIWLKNGPLQTVLRDKFFTTLLATLRPLCRRNEYFELNRSVLFKFIDSLKNNDSNYSVLFDDSCGEICNSKFFVDFISAGRHRRLSTIILWHNLFHQSKLIWGDCRMSLLSRSFVPSGSEGCTPESENQSGSRSHLFPD